MVAQSLRSSSSPANSLSRGRILLRWISGRSPSLLRLIDTSQSHDSSDPSGHASELASGACEATPMPGSNGSLDLPCDARAAWAIASWSSSSSSGRANPGSGCALLGPGGALAAPPVFQAARDRSNICLVMTHSRVAAASSSTSPSSSPFSPASPEPSLPAPRTCVARAASKSASSASRALCRSRILLRRFSGRSPSLLLFFRGLRNVAWSTSGRAALPRIQAAFEQTYTVGEVAPRSACSKAGAEPAWAQTEELPPENAGKWLKTARASHG